MQRGLEGLKEVCKTGLIIDCKALSIWTHVELYKIFHDKAFISAYEASMEKKGFKDGKVILDLNLWLNNMRACSSLKFLVQATFKDAVADFLANAAQEHSRRREYLARRISQIYHTLADCPGLLGPHWGLVISTLALAKEEIMWYFQHRIPLPKDEKVFHKAKLDIGVHISDIASLITSSLQLRGLAMKV